METLSVVELKVIRALLNILVREAGDKVWIQFLESVLEFLELRQNEELLLVLAYIVIVSRHGTQVVVHAKVFTFVAGWVTSIIDTTILLIADLSPLQGIHHSIVDGNL